MLQNRERRRMVRWQIQRPVRFKLPDQEEENMAVLKDVSFTGAKISLMENLRLSEILDMVMEIPDEENPIFCKGKVVWQGHASEAGKPHFFCGLSFTQIKDADKEKMFNYVWKTAPEELRRQWWGAKK